jgi:integrase
MARQAKGLTDTAVKTAKPAEKQRAMFDGGGLYLLIMPNGGKYWRFKYRFDGKEKYLSFGTYPEITLASARERRNDARRMVAEGVDPGVLKKKGKETEKAEEVKAALTFKVVALEWYGNNKVNWSLRHTEDVLNKLEKDVFPVLGDTPIDTLKPSHVLACVKRIEARGAVETAHRTRQIIEQICGYALANEYADLNVAALTKGALAKVPKTTPHPAITDPKELAPLLRAIDGYTGSYVVRYALIFGALTAVRPGELRHAEWSEIDFGAATWNIPGEKMKMKQPHLVPLSRQAVAILKELQAITGASRYIFPNGRSFSKPLSENGTRQALISLDYQNRHSGHGWRATFRTIGDEVLNFRPEILEHQLAHAVRDSNGRAYNRTAHLEERRKMMQVWADYLEHLRHFNV